MSAEVACYICRNFPSGFTLTPAHFLTGNLKTAIPLNLDNYEDSEYTLAYTIEIQQCKH